MPTRLEAIITKQVNLFLTGSASIPGDSCNIFRLMGNPRVLTQIFTNEPCRVDDLNPGNDPGLNEINASLNAKKITVRAATVLLIDDQITHAGHTYEVYAVLTDRTPSFDNTVLMRLVTT